MTCIIDSLFYNLLVHVCLFHGLYCEVLNSGDGGSDIWFGLVLYGMVCGYCLDILLWEIFRF